MTPDRRRQISGFATSVRQALRLETPVDMREAVNRLGGELRIVDPFEIEYEAIVEKVGDGFRISLTNDKADVRQNFSIAHEVAHLFLHMGYIVSPDRWNAITKYEDSVRARHGYTEEEHEANQFAAAFLMPDDEFVKVAASAYDGKHYNLRTIADHFGVSEQAAKTRGQWLGIFSWG